MEMTYDGALVMPKSFAAVSEEEMTYVEGGGTFYIEIKSNSFLITLLAAAGTTLTVAKATAILSGASIAIATAIELGTAGMGTLYAGAFLLAAGTVIPAIAGAAVGYGINWLKGKKFKIASGSWIPNKTIRI